MSNYDNWKTTTPEDEEHEERDRIDQAQARIERQIDELETPDEPSNPAKRFDGGGNRIPSHWDANHFAYDPFNP
jgi:hypothetical protein